MLFHLLIGDFERLFNQSQAFIQLFFRDAQRRDDEYHRAQVFNHDEGKQPVVLQHLADLGHYRGSERFLRFSIFHQLDRRE